MKENNRGFKIEYSQEDMRMDYQIFTFCLSHYYDTNSKKKIKRILKRYKWYDYYYTNKLLLAWAKRYSKLEEKKLYEQIWFNLRGKFWNFSGEKLPYSNEKLENKIKELLDSMIVVSPDYYTALVYYTQYLVAKYYYCGHAVDEDTKPICESLQELFVQLENENTKKAAKVYARDFAMWWD